MGPALLRPVSLHRRLLGDRLTRRGVLLAGRLARRAERILHLLEDFARETGLSFAAPETLAELDAAARAARGADLVVVAGGDGTLRRVVRGLAGKEPMPLLGLLPAGTVNVVARDLGVPLSLGRALEAMAVALRRPAPPKRPYDLGCFRAGPDAEPEPFLLSAGFGIEAEAIARTPGAAKRALGAAAFLASGLRLDPEAVPSVRVETQGISLRGNLAAVLNAGRYGGSFRVLSGDPADGLLDLFVARVGSRFALAALAARAVTRGLPALRLREVTVEADGAIPYHLDGDLAGYLMPGARAEISSKPRALSFLALSLDR